MSIYPLKSISDIGLERLDLCSRVVGQLFFRAVRPCFILDEMNQPTAVGTCFFIELDGIRYLMTAAHVLDEAEFGPMYVASGKSFVSLTGLFSVTSKPDGRRDNDRYDFAFVELTQDQCVEMNAEFFITESMISQNRAIKERRGYMALGFPEHLQLVNYGACTAFTEAWTYVGFHRHSEALNESLGINGDAHFAIRFEDRVKTFKGDERNAPDPRGTSGGILIDLGNFDPEKLRPDEPCKGLLAGILIEHHREHETILATDIRFAMAHMRRSRPRPSAG